MGYISVVESLRISSTCTCMQCAAKAIEFDKITQNVVNVNVVKITPLRRSRSFKVTDFGTNRKLIYNFLLTLTYLVSCTVSKI